MIDEVVVEAIAAGVKEGWRTRGDLLVNHWRTGTVQSVDLFNARAIVLIDNDLSPTPVQTLTNDIKPGARAMVVFASDGGAFAVGPLGHLPWTGYTPTITQGGAVAFGVNYSRWSAHGRDIHYEGHVAITAVSPATAAITVSLPVPAAFAAPLAASGSLIMGHTTAGNVHTADACRNTTSTIWGVMNNNGGGILGNNAPANHQLENGDSVSWSVTYESAS